MPRWLRARPPDRFAGVNARTDTHRRGVREQGKDTLCSIENADKIVVSLLLCASIKFVLTLFTFGLKIPG